MTIMTTILDVEAWVSEAGGDWGWQLSEVDLVAFKAVIVRELADAADDAGLRFGDDWDEFLDSYDFLSAAQAIHEDMFGDMFGAE